MMKCSMETGISRLSLYWLFCNWELFIAQHQFTCFMSCYRHLPARHLLIIYLRQEAKWISEYSWQPYMKPWGVNSYFLIIDLDVVGWSPWLFARSGVLTCPETLDRDRWRSWSHPMTQANFWLFLGRATQNVQNFFTELKTSLLTSGFLFQPRNKLQVCYHAACL